MLRLLSTQQMLPWNIDYGLTKSLRRHPGGPGFALRFLRLCAYYSWLRTEREDHDLRPLVRANPYSVPFQRMHGLSRQTLALHRGPGANAVGTRNQKCR